jgi:hypothetical protein
MKKPMLSAHFSFDELTGSDKFPELVEKNRLEASAFTGKLSMLCRGLLEPIRDQFGPAVITSGYRCPALNKALHGEDTSQHTRAEAADFIIPGCDLDEVFAWIRSSGLEYGQVILEPGWIHLSLGTPFRQEDKCQEALVYDGKTYRKA